MKTPIGIFVHQLSSETDKISQLVEEKSGIAMAVRCHEKLCFAILR